MVCDLGHRFVNHDLQLGQTQPILTYFLSALDSQEAHLIFFRELYRVGVGDDTHISRAGFGGESREFSSFYYDVPILGNIFHCTLHGDATVGSSQLWH